MRKRKQPPVRDILFVAMAGFVISMGFARPTAADDIPVVQTVIVEAEPTTLSRAFFGRVQARETVDLAFAVGGTLARLVPEEGMRVAAGDVIAQLRRDDFERAVARAALQLEMAARDAERARQLADRAVGAATRAEDSETARALADVTLKDAQAALSDATLVAPFDALVAARLTPAESIVAPGQAILRLHDISEMRVEIDLPERVFVVAGGLDAMRFAAETRPGGMQPLRLVAFQPDAAQVGQSYRVTLAFVENPGSALLPGASVTVIASIPQGGGGVTVPSSAVLAGNDRSAAVLVVEGTGDMATVRRVSLDIATRTGTTFAAAGLKPGTEIVAIGAHRLRDGQRVRRFAGLRTLEE